jgi:hypothetical protein
MPQKLDNMGQICHLRGYRQNPSNMVYGYMFKVEQKGLRWSNMECPITHIETN